MRRDSDRKYVSKADPNPAPNLAGARFEYLERKKGSGKWPLPFMVFSFFIALVALIANEGNKKSASGTFFVVHAEDGTSTGASRLSGLGRIHRAHALEFSRFKSHLIY